MLYLKNHININSKAEIITLIQKYFVIIKNISSYNKDLIQCYKQL